MIPEILPSLTRPINIHNTEVHTQLSREKIDTNEPLSSPSWFKVYGLGIVSQNQST